MDLGLAIEQLRSHNLSDLFTQTLGWNTPKDIATAQHLNQPCVPIAVREEVVVWQVSLTAKTRFAPALRHQIYTALQRGLPASPLVIFIAADGRRSLWCQSAYESALYVAGSPVTLWQYRLRRLAKGCQGLFPTISEGAGGETFAGLVELLCKGTTGIDSVAQRRMHSVLTLQRLMFIQQIQQKGWLAGDTWYLQVRFGEAMQKGENLFFATCLQPLYRCLSLPAVERPLALQQSVGTVPFLGQLFHTHWLEEKYASIAIEDSAIEAVLGWLSEQASVDALNPWMCGDSGYWLAQYWMNQRGVGDGVVCTPKVAREMCDRTLDQLLLNRLDVFASAGVRNKKQNKDTSVSDKALLSSGRAAQDKTLTDLLFTADSQVCRRLIQEILPELRILDPHCGSGQLLVAFHQRLTDIFSILTGYIQQTKDAQLKIWRSALVTANDAARSDEGSSTLLKNLQERVLKNNLYGVAATPEVVVSAHFQLLLQLVATAERMELIEPLMDLEFNVMPGNALMGFITVDEERFDQVNKAGADSVLQGNLLQPLAADSYQTILSEKNIALEHYQSRSQLLAETHSVPPYARAALLREEILTLDSRAQHKLDTLLLSHMSQQLGIRYRESQLIGKPHRRPLVLSDVEQFSPFHWGYSFNAVIKRGGFDVVACAPIWGAFKPTVAEFLQQSEDLAVQKGLSEKTLKTSKQALAKGDADVAEAWFGYQDRYVCMTDYFARSELYAHQVVTGRGRAQFVQGQLFVERCFHLVASRGTGAVLMLTDLLESDFALTLKGLLGHQEGAIEAICSDAEDSEAVTVVWEKS
ncbi:MAG: hypothetical protein ACFB0D_01990 [Phormidesmis sp.]